MKFWDASAVAPLLAQEQQNTERFVCWKSIRFVRPMPVSWHQVSSLPKKIRRDCRLSVLTTA